MDIEAVRRCIESGRYEWRKHTLIRLGERGIAQQDILTVISRGEVIEEYPDDRPFPSTLILGWAAGKPYHVVVALDKPAQWVYIITAYVPSRDKFQSDFKTRIKP